MIRCALAEPWALKMCGATAVDVDDLASNVRSVEHQEPHCAGDVVGLANPTQQGMANYRRLFVGREVRFCARVRVWPHYCAGGDRIDANVWCKFDRQ